MNNWGPAVIELVTKHYVLWIIFVIGLLVWAAYGEFWRKNAAGFTAWERKKLESITKGYNNIQLIPKEDDE